MEVLILISLVLIVALVIWSFWQVRSRFEELKSLRQSDQALLLMQQQIDHLREQVVTQLNQIGGQVGQRLDSAAKVVGEVHNRLGQLAEANTKIYEVGKDIASLQEILRAPKIRGTLGELFLSDLLSQILPPRHFTLQHCFRSGEKVDAAIHLGQGLVPVDSKFPLENFRRMIEAQSEEEKRVARRQFSTDVKKHIDSIAQKYILPDEGTFDFALMYIPAENVYYETIIKDENFGEEKSICHYALERRVIPVSPNSFYAYLQAILLGLKGLRIEKRALEVIQGLKTLQMEFGKFREEFNKMGRHLSDSKLSYERAEKRLDRFSDRLTQVEEMPGALGSEVKELPE